MGTWTPEQRESVAERFSELQVPYADDSWRRISARLDEFVSRWVTLQAKACRGSMSKERDARAQSYASIACLENARQVFVASVVELEEIQPGSVAMAAELSHALPDISSCGERQTSRWAFVRTEDVGVRTAVRRLRSAQAKRRLGDTESSRAILDELWRRDVVGQSQDLNLEVELEYGFLLGDTGHYKQSAVLLEDAAWVATKLGRDDVALMAMTRLVWTLGYRMSEHAEALGWARSAMLLIRNIGLEGSIYHARLLTEIATVHRQRGDYEKALVIFDDARSMLAEQLGPAHPQVLVAETRAGNAWLEVGENGRALDRHQRYLDGVVKSFGIHHPYVARGLNNLGNVAAACGAHEEAKLLFERSLEILNGSHVEFGRDQAKVAANLGDVLTALGVFSEAAAYHERALSTRVLLAGPEHPVTAVSLTSLGELHLRVGELGAAKRLCGRGLAAKESSLGDEHYTVATSKRCLAQVALAEGRYDEAMGLYEDVLVLRVKVFGAEHPLVEEASKELTLATTARAER